MSNGRFSRNKGRRGEQQLVLHLAKMGYKAERILNQAHTAGLPDVKAVKGEKSYTFEHKSYRDAFKTIYHFYYSCHTKDLDDGVVGACLAEGGPYVAMSSNFENLLASDLHFSNPDPNYSRTYKRLLSLNAKRGKADFLVIKDNNKCRLFLKYWT